MASRDTVSLGGVQVRRATHRLDTSRPAGGPLPAGSSGAPTQKLSDEGALQGLRDSAAPALEHLQERVELLLIAARAAALPLPGVIGSPPAADLPPNKAKLVAYLVPRFQADEALARTAQVAVFRFQSACRALGWPDEPAPPPGGRAEAVRQDLFLLGKLHLDFRAEPMLALLFPPPATIAPGPLAGAPRPATAGERALAERRDAERHRQARLLHQALVGGMTLLGEAVAVAEQGLAKALAAIFNPAARQAAAVASDLRGDAALLAASKATLARFATLEAYLAASDRAAFDPETVRATLFELGQVGRRFAGHPVLGPLFRASRPAAGGPPKAGGARSAG